MTTENIRRFEVGSSYAVFHMLSEELDTVTVAARNGNRVTFTDGRSGKEDAIAAAKAMLPIKEEA